MARDREYSFALSNAEAVTAVLEELLEGGLNVPRTYDQLISTRPFSEELSATPTIRGSKKFPFVRDSHYSDGLLIDLYRTTDFDDIVIEIGRGIESNLAVEAKGNEMNPEYIVEKGSINFVDRANQSPEQTIPFIAYHRP